MESSKVMSTDKATVIIQVNPQVTQGTVICDEQQARGAYHNTALKGFFKAQPKALGTVQIMIGVMVFLFGIVLTTHPYNRMSPTIFIICGITYWGSLIYISAGSLSVAAQNKLHPCVVKASLGMNVISAITAAIAITLMSIEIHIISSPYPRCYDPTDSDICSKFKSYDMGITGVLLVFSILQFIISIVISGFACKATCNNDSTVVNVALNQEEKYQFYQFKIQFLSYNISQHGTFMDERKVDTIRNCSTPTIFQFHHQSTNLSAPWKGLFLSWSPAAIEAFEKLKQAFSTAPHLVHCHPDKPFTVEMDASTTILSQKRSSARCPISNHQVSPVKTLPRMESSKVMSTDKATVIIQVNPQVTQGTVICDEQQARGAYHNTALKGFFKAQPKALGTVQIMIGVVIFLFGIVHTSIYTFETPIFIISGITCWGSLIYISAGSLSVAAENNLHLCVVKASLGMNVISAITAAIAITLMSIEIHIISSPYPRCYDPTDSGICSKFKSYKMGVTGVLLVFSILQFIISIFISGFACKATCNNDSTVVSVALNQVNDF
ncbi:uncharacterized protein LOC131540367 [Onychostoma macrolepis]|uniref:uncharacterized protein LOC131540367 n=1 Tax=Onychostoma macrolepis TaxID=369639 RepID=UPI00272C8357|nr:uncharacterized protein LOC131540367 [Onychostoma macrolepis]